MAGDDETKLLKLLLYARDNSNFRDLQLAFTVDHKQIKTFQMKTYGATLFVFVATIISWMASASQDISAVIERLGRLVYIFL